ncbi:hypothetical protein BDZ45DRAFT_803377 [Acephala macrosclerotiorum]|nr:hypothetical protein BDZ45DRAFT_803377 [Acephala macrosclerotiorum]
MPSKLVDSPEELENKILTKSESITEPENNLLRYSYHLYLEEYVPAFQETVSVNSLGVNPHMLNNAFRLIESEVMKSLTDSPISNPLIWAYKADFIPSANSTVTAAGEKYEGRMKVALNSLFFWFYAARKEELYSMKHKGKFLAQKGRQ